MFVVKRIISITSPSIRREWIEMCLINSTLTGKSGLPPYGGSGLKSLVVEDIRVFRKSPSIRREWIEIKAKSSTSSTGTRLPPYGGSGLKYYDGRSDMGVCVVSLHTEGVD